MIYHQRTLSIEAGPEEVWQELGQFMHIDRFAPEVVSVDALTQGEDRLGSKRRCNFANGGSVVEEVTKWQPGQGYRVRLSEMGPMPLAEAHAELRIVSKGAHQTEVVWGMEYRVKYGVFGWLLGQTLMKMMMGKVLDGNLRGLAEKVRESRAAAA